ncbi:hypothetical protein PR048_002355 [Dryococelus australis]|uniref:Uncharacterized protein n=1 Tax=Dryococelus australis TaxID=614101 RepID=A0ABQ9ILE4_9NEOP|nr:hypothetical protein PR048_002355 [Dryococelus australis]
MEMAYHLAKGVYNERSISFNEKLRHYCSVIHPEVLYALECLKMNKKGLIEKLEAKERKILRKILALYLCGEDNQHHPKKDYLLWTHDTNEPGKIDQPHHNLLSGEENQRGLVH